MNKTVLTTNDLKNIIENIYAVPVPLTLSDGEGERETNSVDELDIGFYAWREFVDNEDSWSGTFANTLPRTIALVELTNCTVLPSPDIDSASITGRIEFLIDPAKAAILDYTTMSRRNELMGVPQHIQSNNGELLKAYINLGICLYEEEPQETPFGERLKVVVNFTIGYMTEAKGYNDYDVKFGFYELGVFFGVYPYAADDWDDFPSDVEINMFVRERVGDEYVLQNGDYVEVRQTVGAETRSVYYIWDFVEQEWAVKDTKFGLSYSVPYSNANWQLTFAGQPASCQSTNNRVGVLNSSASMVVTFTMFDFNKDLNKRLNKIFWRTAAYKIGGVKQTATDVNIPILVSLTDEDGVECEYLMVVADMAKAFANADFTVTTITLKQWGKDAD